ncbi:MAG: MerR family transcriptional regulator [Nocardioidaceae bacterium]|nr:MerR family transcriptional regulator [Nocardioidaceae bacterium]
MAERSTSRVPSVAGEHAPDVSLVTIGAVAAQLSVPSTTLRTWSRRYGLSPTGRTAGGHRRFNPEDVQRLHVMVHLLGLGVAAGSAAQKARDALPADLARSWAVAPGQAAFDHLLRSGPVAVVEALVAAAQVLDPTTIDALTGLSIDRSGVEVAWDQVMAPFLACLSVLRLEVGADEVAGAVVEQLAIERLVGVLSSPHRQARSGPSVLLAGLGDGGHALPLLVVQGALDTDHVPTVNLGRRTPAATVARAVSRLAPAAVFLWSEQPPEDDDGIWSLVGATGQVPLVVVGSPDPRRGGLLGTGAPTSTAARVLAAIRGAL